MKWLIGFCLLMAMALAVLFVPVGGKTLWSQGAGREVARFVARGLRAGWDALASIDAVAKPDKAHPVSTRAPPAHSQKPRKVAGRDGILPQPPKEKLPSEDKEALRKLIEDSR